jgi:hypothetical protein
MTTTVNINRQTRLVAYRDFDSSDFTTAVAKNLIYLPNGARVLSGFVDVTTVFGGATGGTHTIEVGDTVGTDDVDRYLGSTSVASTALTALVPVKNSVIPSGGAWVTATVTSNQTPTGGAGRLQVEYVVDDRVTEYEAYRG